MNAKSNVAHGSRRADASLSRIAAVARRFYVSEPLLFGAWSLHTVAASDAVRTVRVGRGRVEINPAFLETLTAAELELLMRFECVRILLKHPYERRRPNGPLAWEASNMAIQECLNTALPAPDAVTRLGKNAPKKKSFEVYYALLTDAHERSDRPLDGSERDSAIDDRDVAWTPSVRHDDNENESCQGELFDEAGCRLGDLPGECDGTHPPAGVMSSHFDSEAGFLNTVDWDVDPYIAERVDEVIVDAEASNNWGTMGRDAMEEIIASLRPKLDYRRVLRAFRANVLSNRRSLTRMKPSRRYGFEYLGSRREYSTRLLFAVDVSGSVSSDDLKGGFSIVNRFFKYGVEAIDVIWFDTRIVNDEPLTMRRAQREISVRGRGGTSFQPLMDYLDRDRSYDGLIVFTDGIAPTPNRPQRNRRTRILWLFHNEERWRRQYADLVQPGMASAFVREG